MFKKIPVKLEGFRDGNFFVKELSIAKLRKVMEVKGDEIELLLAALEYSLVDSKGDCVICKNYTIEQFADDMPQSYLNDLAEAYTKLSEVDEIDIAKKS